MSIRSLGCPVPSDINPLSVSGFNFNITKLPLVSYFCQECPLPEMMLPYTIQKNPFSDIYLPGDVIEFKPLTIEFIVDSHVLNYISIDAWMRGLGFPENYNQYKAYNESADQSLSEGQRVYSDATLSILDANSNPVSTVRFENIYPISLSGMVFKTTTETTRYLTGTCTFVYQQFKFI